MLEIDIATKIFTSFAGTILAILSASVIWLVKLAYEKHKAEVLALAKFERMFVQNIPLLQDNLQFINQWIEALKNNRPFSFHIEKLITNEEATYKLSNLKLVNKILSLNYKSKRICEDLENIYKSYWDVIIKIQAIQDKEEKQRDLIRYHKTVSNTLEEMKKNYEPIKKELIDVIANIRVIGNVRKHSLFGYLDILFIDVVPRVTKKDIGIQIKIIEDQVAKIENDNK